jgi:hypothetical protein
MDRIASHTGNSFAAETRRRVRLFGRTAGLALSALVIAVSGCCTPFGPGCDPGHCYDCDGTAGRPIPTGPLMALKQQLTCGGGGCGEVYKGEWISTPPDCADPCCDDQFVGGAVPSQPFCWTLGSLFAPGQFSGRFEGGRGCCDTCGDACDSCCDGDFVEQGWADEPMIESPTLQPAGGCSTCTNRIVQGGVANLNGGRQLVQSRTYNQNRSINQEHNSRTRTAAVPQSQRKAASAVRSPMPRTTRVPNTNQDRTASQSDRMIRQASSTVRQAAPARMANAPRSGSNRNRVLQ